MITILYAGDERDLGPAEDVPVKFLTFLPLVTRNAKGELEGRLAESWEHSPDYRTWTIHLRKDVRWQDGVPVTAHDVKFTLDLLSNPEVLWEPPGAYSVTVLDDSTYTITYRQRADGTPLDDYTVYYPKHLLEKLDPKKFSEWDFWTHPVGDGPYRYVRHVPKTMMEFEADPNYFRGKPKIERVLLQFGNPFGHGAMTELLSGNVDVKYCKQTDYLQVTGDPRFRYYYSIDPDSHVKAILWNHRLPFFRDPKVRRALTLAINRRELYQLQNLPEALPVFDVLFTERQFRRGELPEALSYNPELAKRLLDEAGWRDTDGSRIRDGGGKKFRFAALVPLGTGFGGSLEKAAVYIQAQLRQVGVQMDVQTLDEGAVFNRVKAGAFEAAFFWLWGVPEGEPYGELNFFGEGSYIGYSNPKVTALLKELAVAFNPDEEDRIYRELWPIFQADLPVTYLYPQVSATVAYRRVRGLSSPWRADPVRYMDDLCLDDRGER